MPEDLDYCVWAQEYEREAEKISERIKELKALADVASDEESRKLKGRIFNLENGRRELLTTAKRWATSPVGVITRQNKGGFYVERNRHSKSNPARAEQVWGGDPAEHREFPHRRRPLGALWGEGIV